MKREEAIKTLKAKIDTMEDGAICCNYGNDKEVFNMATKALEQEPSEDCVSRTEVKKIVKEMYLEVANMKLDVTTISDCISYTSSKCREVLERKLQTLPSVTPVSCIAKITYNKDDLQKLVDEKVKEIVVERKKGHWILLDECSNSGYYCSECRKKVVKEGWSNTVKKIKYCPNCGAEMENE